MQENYTNSVKNNTGRKENPQSSAKLVKMYYFLRSSCFLDHVIYEFQAKDELSKLKEVPLECGSFHELSKTTVRRKVIP